METRISDSNKKVSFFSQNFLNLVPVICSLMVILIHMHNVTHLPPTSTLALIVNFFSHGLCVAAVPMFMFMSGYLFYRNIKTLEDVFRKQKKRVISVFIPFIAWSSSYYLLYALGSKFISEISSTVDTSLLGVITGIIFYRYSFPMWYMFQLCIFIALAPIVFFVLKNKYVSWTVLIISVIVGMFIKSSISISLPGYERSLFQVNFFAYYLAGCFATKLPELVNKVNGFAKRMPLVLLTILFVLFGFVESLFYDKVIPSFNTRCMVPLVFISFLLLMLKLCQTRRTIPKSPISPMIIYGIHSFVGIILSSLIFNHFHLPVLLSYILRFIAVTVVSFGIGYIMKFIKPIYYLYSGGR